MNEAAATENGGRRVAVLLVAAGRGTRAGGVAGGIPKQYRDLGGIPVLARTAAAFLRSPRVHTVRTVIRPDDTPLHDAAMTALASGDDRVRPPVFGGAERQVSVRLGLEALAEQQPDLVLIHDAVRPFLAPGTLEAAIGALDRDPAIVVGTRIVDTIKRTGPDGRISDTVPRDGLWRAETPQGFDFRMILAAHQRAAREGVTGFTDDAAVAEWAGHPVRMVAGGEGNMKLTTVEDFDLAERRLRADAYLRLADVRVGTGYDVHALEPGEGVVLNGVFIPHTHRLRGHSDADVALHALTDAILGALGDGDIGQHFPPSDGRWRGCESSVFLADAVRRLAGRGGILAHCDVNLIAEAPKIGPHREAMRQKIAEICGISLDRVGVKATTNEGLGFAGRREGIAAIATATIRLPLPE